jgi:hypothetical protein
VPTATRSRSEERNAQARATLTPLAPGERPWPIVVGAIIAVLSGGGTLIAYLAGAKTQLGVKPGLGGVVLFTGIMLVCAVGMLALRYWAVLGFMTLLALMLLSFSLALVKANLLGVAICLAVLIPGGYLFYKFVRVLGRIQMPRPPSK